MKAVLVKKENNIATFTMEFTAEEFADGVKKAYNRNKSYYPVDGFRKGKAPQSLIEKHYGEGVFFEDGLDIAMNEQYPKALDELALNPINRPAIDFEKDEKIEKGKGFKLTVQVTVAPEPELKKYKGLTVEKVESKVTAEDVDREVENLRQRNARIVSVEREAKNGDTLMLDYKGFSGEEQFEGGTAENQPLTLGSNTFIPGFEEQLIGVKAGETREVKVTFPKEYHAENLAGKEAVFQCLVHEVKETELPELNDDFAAEVSEFDTLDEMKKDIEKKLQKDADDEAAVMMKNAAIDELVKNNDVDVPEIMVDDEIDSLVNQFDQRLQSQGLTLDMYLQYAQQTMEDFRKARHEEALNRVKATLLVEAIARAEAITATPEDVEAEMKSMADTYGMKLEQVKQILGNRAKELEKDIVNRKAIDFLFSQAKLVAKKAEKKASAKKEDEKEATEETAEKKAPARKSAKKKAEDTKDKEDKEGKEEASEKKAPVKKTASKKTAAKKEEK